ncbi:MAG: type II toxin-antitoxin system PemK/MazF family toxin [Candidatus Marinimicrobia bacterium]|nr:type II toxin-antitoxin system PemK/MazF family toxin [Candidatus Neomarinimicrobiota bacterium]
MKRGEIRWYKFHTPDKKRPVLLLTRDSILEYMGEVTIAPITSTIRDIPSEVFLSTQDGLKKDCAVNCDHIQTVSKGKIDSLIVTLSQEKLAKVSAAINFALSL